MNAPLRTQAATQAGTPTGIKSGTQAGIQAGTQAPESETVPTRAILGGLVYLGLAAFWEQALPRDDRIYGWLRTEARGRLDRHPWLAECLDPSPQSQARADWDALVARVQPIWPPTQGALGRAIAELALDLPGALILALAGELESAHLPALALSELQSPGPGPRPSLHLADALIDALFGAEPGRGSPALDLVAQGLLTMEGEGPRPLRALRMDPGLWDALCDGPALWPGCRPLAQDDPELDPGLLPAEARDELPRVAGLILAGELDAVAVRGGPGSGRLAWAAALARACGRQALSMGRSEWGGDAALVLACRFGAWLPVLEPRLGPGEVLSLAGSRVPVLAILGGDGALECGRLLELELKPPREPERLALWTRYLSGSGPVPGSAGIEALAAGLAGSAPIGGPLIRRIAAWARLRAERLGEPLALDHVAEARQELGAERLRLLAQPVPRRVGRDALVLGPQIAESLDDLILRARRRESLWEGLGVTLAATPSPGLRALLVGESGTGKTLAASYVATALGAPLWRVDLAAVMNKYIGESEKNLGALLDLAAGSDPVLLFDEADSLFGRRTEGRETGERYANMLTNFLLTRIESHPGVVLLTANSRERIDSAFTRRLDLILELPLPGYEERLRLWESHLGGRGPGADLCRTLAGACDLSGGQIRNAVLAAAARGGAGSNGAGSDGPGPIAAADLVRAVESEYLKVGKHPPGQILRMGSHGGA